MGTTKNRRTLSLPSNTRKPRNTAASKIDTLENKVVAMERDIHTLIVENNRLNAENRQLSIKLRDQIARGNRLAERLRRAGVDEAAQDGVPESPTVQAAVRAYLRANPGKDNPTREELTAWMTSGNAVVTPA